MSDRLCIAYGGRRVTEPTPSHETKKPEPVKREPATPQVTCYWPDRSSAIGRFVDLFIDEPVCVITQPPKPAPAPEPCNHVMHTPSLWNPKLSCGPIDY